MAKVKFTEALPAVMENGGYEIAKMLHDPELNFYYSYRFIIDVIAIKNSNASKLAKVNVPVLILHGRNDTLVFPEVSEEFFKMIDNQNKKLQVLDCDHWFHHAVFYEQSSRYSEESRAQIIEKITNWGMFSQRHRKE